MSAIWLWLAAALMAATALLHSVLGERKLIAPILALHTGVLAVPLARQVLRFGWHLTSGLMVVCAAAMIEPRSPARLIAIIGSIWLLSGLADAVYTRGRHIGWPALVAAGAFALLGSIG